MSSVVKIGLSLVSLVMTVLVICASPLKAQPVVEKGAAELAAVTGVWLTKEGKSHLKVTPCGKSLCNEIVWLKQPLDRHGKPQTDKLNKDGKLRGRPIIGISILLNMHRVQNNMWRGWLYDPEKGKAFKGHARLITADKMEIKGCHSVLPICKTHIWKKVSDLESYKQAQN